jgi:protein-S-isoprenylcysteine O-methyltransferase Ste14
MPFMIKISIFFSFLYLVSELMLLLTKHSLKKSAVKQKDRGSLIFMWVSICTSLTFGFIMARYNEWYLNDYFIASIGLLMIVFGFIIRWTAIMQLKNAFTVDVAINNTHELKTNGLYSIVRHPSYLGLLMIMTGEAVSMDSLGSFVIVVLLVTLSIFYRIYVEEKLLKEEFGEMYMDYKRNTKRIIPYIY